MSTHMGVIDFWKAPFGPDPLPASPDLLPLGITPIQTACLGGAAYAMARVVGAGGTPLGRRGSI